MMQQDVLPADSVEHRVRIAPDAHVFWRIRRVLQIGPGRFVVEVEKTLQAYESRHTEHQRLVQVEVRYQPLDNLRMRPGFNLQPYGVAFTPLRHLRVDGVQ